MNTTAKKDWTNRLITGLFTAAAAWGSVTVEIGRVTNARAEITEQRLSTKLDETIHAAVKELKQMRQADMDTLRGIAANVPLPVVSRPAPILVEAPLDTSIAARQAAIMEALDKTNDRLRHVAIAMAQLQIEQDKQRRKTELPEIAPRPKR